MGKKRNFYRTIIELEVLSDCRVKPNMELEGVIYEITDGAWSGLVTFKPSEKVDRKTIVKLLEAQGSDGDFLFIGEGDID